MLKTLIYNLVVVVINCIIAPALLGIGMMLCWIVAMLFGEGIGEILMWAVPVFACIPAIAVNTAINKRAYKKGDITKSRFTDIEVVSVVVIAATYGGYFLLWVCH